MIKMDLVYTHRYPEFDDFQGTAKRIHIKFTTLRTGIGAIDEFAVKISQKAFESTIVKAGGVPLYSNVYNETSSRYWLPTYDWDFYFDYYEPADINMMIAPAIVLAIIAVIKILAVGLVAYIIVTGVTDIVYGPEGPEGIRPGWSSSILPVVILAGTALSIGYLYKIYIEKK